MSNVLNEQTKQQIIALGRLGWSLRQIERATGVRRETAAAHLRAAGVEPRPPGGWGHPPSAKPAIQVTTGSEPPEAAPEAPSPPAAEPSPEPPTTASACEPYREIIAAALAKGRNAMAIWQDLVDQSGFAASYQSVKRFVGGVRPTAAAQPCGIIVTDPGQEAQVDYGGDTVPVRDPATGKYRSARLFVLTLGYSRKCVRLLTFQSSTRDWAELHQRAFRALGGVTRTVVLDNLKEGVLSPDIWDPALNPVYRDMLAHYGVVALPCRVNDPDRKGKVERAVGHAQNTALKGLRFESLELAQAHLDHWERRWADTRIHGTTKRQVAAMFAEERPALLPLPLEPFRIYQFGNRTVHLDGCVEVEAAYYSVPPGWISRLVAAQWDGHHVRGLPAGALAEAGPQDRTAAARAHPPGARTPPARRTRPVQRRPPRRPRAPGACGQPRSQHRNAVPVHVPTAWAGGGAADPGRARTGQQTRADGGGASLRLRPGGGRVQLPIRARMAGADPGPTPARPQAGRSADPPTDRLPRPRGTTRQQRRRGHRRPQGGYPR